MGLKNNIMRYSIIKWKSHSTRGTINSIFAYLNGMESTDDIPLKPQGKFQLGDSLPLGIPKKNSV